MRTTVILSDSIKHSFKHLRGFLVGEFRGLFQVAKQMGALDVVVNMITAAGNRDNMIKRRRAVIGPPKGPIHRLAADATHIPIALKHHMPVNALKADFPDLGSPLIPAGLAAAPNAAILRLVLVVPLNRIHDELGSAEMAVNRVRIPHPLPDALPLSRFATIRVAIPLRTHAADHRGAAISARPGRYTQRGVVFSLPALPRAVFRDRTPLRGAYEGFAAVKAGNRGFSAVYPRFADRATVKTVFSRASVALSLGKFAGAIGAVQS